MPEPYYEVMSYSESKAFTSQQSMVLIANVGQAVNGIVTSILTAAAGVSLDSLDTVLPDYLNRNDGFASSMKEQPIGTIDDLVKALIRDDYHNIIIALKAGIGQGVGATHAALYESLIGTNALLQGYRGLLQQVAISPYIARHFNDKFTPNIPDAETAWFMQHIGAITPEQFKAFLTQNGWGADWIPTLDMAWQRQAPIPMILDFKRRALISDDTLKTMLRWYRLPENALDLTSKLSIQYPEPYRLAEMYAKGLIGHDDYMYAVGTFGLESKYADAYHTANVMFPNFEQNLMMLRRGIINDSEFSTYMHMNSFGDAQANQLKQLQAVIPPIQDLIRFAVREAYLDHDPEKQYSSMVDIARQMGLSEEASAWYWYSHWDRIPVTLMYQNYYRGHWTVEKLERMLKIVDIHPDDRSDIIRVAYQPPSIREMGYGYDVGAYTLDDIKRYRRWGGLSPEDAEKAGQSMVAYRTEAERNSVRTEYIYAFGRGALTSEELLQKLTDIKTPAEAIPLWMERADYYRERIQKPQLDVEGKLISSSEALTAFKLNLRNEEWTREALIALDWQPERINVAIEKAKHDIVETEEKETEVKYRKLTLAQLGRMYALEIVTKEQMTTEIIVLGYNADDAELLTEIYTRPEAVVTKPKVFTSAVASNLYALAIYDEDDLYDNFLEQEWSEPQAALLTMYTLISQEYPLLRTMYEKGSISGDDMIKELMKLEMPEFNAKQLVMKTYRELSIDRISHEKDLTKAEIIKGAKNNVLTLSQAAELLVGLGYDQNEAYYILAINKIAEAGDPEGYWDMRKAVEAYKKTRGEKTMEIPDELIMLEREVKKAKAELAEANKLGFDENKVAELTLKAGQLEQRMKQLIQLHKLQ